MSWSVLLIRTYAPTPNLYKTTTGSNTCNDKEWFGSVSISYNFFSLFQHRNFFKQATVYMKYIMISKSSSVFYATRWLILFISFSNSFSVFMFHETNNGLNHHIWCCCTCNTITSNINNFYTNNVMQNFCFLISHLLWFVTNKAFFSQQLGMYLENITIECNFQGHLPTTKTNYMPFQTWLRKKNPTYQPKGSEH